MSEKKYIVVFKDSATEQQIQNYVDQINNGDGKVLHRYDTVLKGFSASLSDNYVSTLKSNLVAGPIDYIEEDGILTTQ
jgi:hypothetical protein